MRRAFSLVELMIVVAVLGILAAIIVPQFQEHSTHARKAVAQDSLRILRSTIELYAAQHGGVPPGYQDNDPATVPSAANFMAQTVTGNSYMLKMPENPFNNLDTMLVIPNSSSFPAEATGDNGWVYQPATMTIRLDWPGTDEDNIPYFAY